MAPLPNALEMSRPTTHKIAIRAKVINTIRINKPTRYRIIVPALEVIQPNIAVVIISPISKRIDFGNSRIVAVGLYGVVAPGIVDVACYLAAVFVIDAYDVAHEVLLIVVAVAVVAEAYYAAVAIVVADDTAVKLVVSIIIHYVRAVVNC